MDLLDWTYDHFDVRTRNNVNKTIFFSCSQRMKEWEKWKWRRKRAYENRIIFSAIVRKECESIEGTECVKFYNRSMSKRESVTSHTIYQLISGLFSDTKCNNKIHSWSAYWTLHILLPSTRKWRFLFNYDYYYYWCWTFRLFFLCSFIIMGSRWINDKSICILLNNLSVRHLPFVFWALTIV